MLKILLNFLLLIAIVVALSIMNNNIWQQKPEFTENAKPVSINITEQMTIRQIADAYGVDPKELKKSLKLTSPADLDKTVAELGLNKDDVNSSIRAAAVIAGEESSKNWIKIPLKFILWITMLVILFRMMRNGKVTPKLRKILLFAAIVVFGVILGSDPSPMGTVKDAIVLWGKEHVIFPPRLIALVVFTLMVVLANKLICSWGCQFGVLQDLIFRLNRNAADSAAKTKQWKLPFVFTNSVRVIFFIAIIIYAVVMTVDIVSPIDPFKIFNPANIAITGIIFISILLILSLFIYRPWCHLFCPFGLWGWIFEKISVYKIKVNYDTCIACEACSKACPSNVMDAILKQDKTIPDCFSCGTCQNVCPTKSISYEKGKRMKPPAEKFKK
jgi:polyferredoxin